MVAELFEKQADALAVGAAAVLHRVFAQRDEVGVRAGEGLFVDGQWLGAGARDARVIAQPQPGQGGKRQAGEERQQPRQDGDLPAPEDAVDESRADGERIGLLLEQLCNHSETYLENLRGDDERIRANRPLLTVYLPELTYISLLYLQLPAAELGEHNRRQLLQLVRDTHDLVQNGHQHQRARTLRDLETRMEVLRERLHPSATEPRQNEAKN